MSLESPLTTVAHTIQLSVAPVFLLTALGTFLGVLSTRLSRIIDRARVLGERVVAVTPAQQIALKARAAPALPAAAPLNMAITCGVMAALLVCTIISSLFMGSILEANVSWLTAVLFVAAMLAFTAALLLFLREILVAVASVRIDG